MKKLIKMLGLLMVTTACQKSNVIKKDALKVQSGINLAAMDRSIRPQDDFYSYVNGNWIKSTDIPSDKAAYGEFIKLRDKSIEQVKELIIKAKENNTPESKKIDALYNSFMNKEAITAHGLDSLHAEFKKIDTIGSYKELLKYFAYADFVSYDVPFGIYVAQDKKDVEKNITYIHQAGLGLPDRDYYFDESKKGKELIKAYKDFLTEIQKHANIDNPSAKTKDIFALEEKLAKFHWTKEDNRDAIKKYNKLSIKELNEVAPKLEWQTYLKEQKITNIDTLIVNQPSYLKALNEIIINTDLKLWRSYLKVKVIQSLAWYMSDEFVDLVFDFYHKKLNGIMEIKPRYKRGVDFVNTWAGELVGKLYVEKHFPPFAKKRMEKLVNNLKAAYKESIKSITWMSDETKKHALEKLEGLITKIGYPDEWRDYSTLDVKKNDLMFNVQAVRTFASDYNRAKLKKPVNKKEWFMSPQTVNAYFNPSMNEIVFPAAILQPPFFNVHADDAINYGAIGAVIGHEIGHSFDDQGSRYDAKGRLNNWWTEKDRTNFEQLTKKLISQYNAYEPLENEHINGELTLGENIGDLAGLGIALKAYKMSLNGNDALVIDGFTGIQRVFLGWGQVWREKRREEALRAQIKTDPHSPARYRVQGILSNLTDFYTAFNVKEGDKMYLDKSERVEIW